MLLDGKQLAGFIKQRHADQVRSFEHAARLPRLRVISCEQEVVSSKYADIKQQYGRDIGVSVDVETVTASDLTAAIRRNNQDTSVHGIVAQLPLPAAVDSDAVLSGIVSYKDVDALSGNADFLPPTPNAILWLLSGYNIDITNKTVGVIGQGRLVGQPLTRMLHESGQEPLTCDIDNGDYRQVLNTADVIISATGQAGLIRSADIPSGVVVVDGGTSSEFGALVGDVEPTAYERDDITISPVPGGVGPLTVCALFENLLAAFISQELV